MRKLLLLTVSLLLTATTLFAERVSQEDAALVAKNFMSASTTQPGVKKATAAKMVLKKAASATENQYYVYENASGEGWVMVAADDAITPILAYSKTGTFRTDNMPINVRKWLGKYDNFIKKVEADGFVATEEAQNQWKKLRKGLPDDPAGTVVIGPLVQTQWDQDEPYNNLCPGTGTSGEGSTKAYTGCVATAMAQVMKFWEWPVKGTGSHSYTPLNPNTGGSQTKYGTQSANFGNTTYDWANMLNKYTNSASSTQKTAVATLMYHCGVATEMMYGDYEWGGSGTYTTNYGSWSESDNAQNALYNYFGYKKATGYMRDGYTYQGTKYYDSWTDADWTAMVKEELDKNHPIMYGGSGDEGGHSFICDGYDTQNYFHFNWGWSGSNDGWYKLDNLVPGSGGAGGGSYSFSEDQDVIIGIVPNKPDLPDRNVTWMANGSQFTTSVASSGVLSLPTTNPAACDNGKVFVGWTATQNYESATTAPTFAKDGDVIEADATFYAVFATKTTSGGTGTETMEASYSSHDGWTISGTGGSSYWILKSGASITSPAISDLSSVTKVEFQARTYGGSSYNTVNVSTSAGATVGSATASTNSMADKSINVSGLTGSGSLVFTSSTTSSSNGPGINNIKITFAAATVSYSDYSTSCGAVVQCTLSSITLNTNNVTKTFTVGDTFTSVGLVVTASYSNCNSKAVTPTSVSTPDMSTAGQKTVTVSYTENGVTKTATYNITVNAQPVTTTYSVRWHSCTGTNTVTYNAGQALVLPSTPAANAGKPFYGWTTTEHYTGATAPAIISAGGAVNADADYYAVYK